MLDQWMFLVITLLAAAAFLPWVFTSPSLQVKTVGVLAISSLLCTAYILMRASPSNDDQYNRSRSSIWPSNSSGPLRKYAIPLNASLALLVSVNAIQFYGRYDEYEGYWMFCLVPIGEISENMELK